MNLETLRNYCLLKKGVEETFPFDDRTLVFKVMGKMFALADVESFDGVNLKCDPDRSIELRERYFGVEPGYHMNKKHWNTVKQPSDVSDELLYELIDLSYELVVKSLPKSVQNELKA